MLSCVSSNSGQNLKANLKPKIPVKAGRKGPMPKFLLTIGRKPNHAMVYQTGSGRFLVKWKQVGKWKTTTKATLKDAQNFAQPISDKKKVDALPATIPKQSEVQILNEIKTQTKRLGVTVIAAFEEYKNAKEILPEGYSLVDAAKALKEKIRTRVLFQNIGRFIQV